ncbi:LysE family translocator [Arthrobacter pigmenti]
MTGAEYLAFLGASIILALTPGPDTFLTLRFGAGSVRQGLVYAGAVAVGIVIWVILALAGIATLLREFPAVLTVLTIAGGLYLAYLGTSSLIAAVRTHRAPPPAPDVPLSTESRRSPFRVGMISSLTNPKTALFFLALLPPFLPSSPSPVDYSILVVTAAGCVLVYSIILAIIAGRAGRLLLAGSGPKFMDAASGIILLGLGITVIML